MLVLWVTVGVSALGLTAASPATAKSAQGAGTHLAAIHVINLHKAYEARLGRTTQGKIAGTVYPVGTPATHSRGGNNCVEPDCAVYYQGGQVQHTPHVYLLLWGPNWSSDPNQEATASYLESFYHGLGTQPQDDWSTTTEQYKDGTGAPTFGNSVYAGASQDTSAPPPGVSQTQLGAEADAFAATHGITDLIDAQIVVATQSGTCPAGFYAPTCDGGNGYYCAWHSYSNEPYTNLPYVLDAGGKCGENFVNSGSAGTDDGFSMVGGHEYAETVTDPNPNTGWFDPLDLGGGEIGDKCVWSPQSGNVSLHTGSFAMQPLWSNSAYASNPGNGCVMSTDVSGDVTVQSPGNQSSYQSSKLTLQAIGTSSDGYQLAWSATGLPSGLKINSSGLISGQVKALPGSYSVKVSASDTNGTATASFAWTVLADVGSNVTNSGSGLCLNDYRWVTTPANEIVLWKCYSGGNEDFSQPTSGGELIVFGQCLTDPHGNGAGQIQQIYPCTGAANQKWFHNSKHEYILKKNGLCLTDPGNATQDGTPTVIEKCTNASDQHWLGS
jgi:serine protease